MMTARPSLHLQPGSRHKVARRHKENNTAARKGLFNLTVVFAR